MHVYDRLLSYIFIETMQYAVCVSETQFQIAKHIIIFNNIIIYNNIIV